MHNHISLPLGNPLCISVQWWWCNRRPSNNPWFRLSWLFIICCLFVLIIALWFEKSKFTLNFVSCIHWIILWSLLGRFRLFIACYLVAECSPAENAIANLAPVGRRPASSWLYTITKCDNWISPLKLIPQRQNTRKIYSSQATECSRRFDNNAKLDCHLELFSFVCHSN